MPNPLTDELSDEAKASLALKFAEIKERLDAMWGPPAKVVKPWKTNRRGW